MFNRTYSRTDLDMIRLMKDNPSNKDLTEKYQSKSWLSYPIVLFEF